MTTARRRISPDRRMNAPSERDLEVVTIHWWGRTAPREDRRGEIIMARRPGRHRRPHQRWIGETAHAVNLLLRLYGVANLIYSMVVAAF